MSQAFAHFDEPLAWLIRGLITYSYVDSSLNKTPPPGSIGSFDLSFIPDSQARSGLMLRIPATAGAQRCHEDDTYSFEIKLTQVDGNQGFSVRSEECNYLQEFAFDPDNPEYLAGYIYESLSTYVTEFVRWRLGGGELSWAQRQGVPDVDGEPCSASLATWVGQQLALRRAFDATLWSQAPTAVAAAATPAIVPMVTVGNFGLGAGATGAPADALLKGPTRALSIMIALGGLAAVMALFNIALTLALFGVDRMFAVVTNMLLVIMAGGGGVVAWFGLREFRAMKGTVLPWVAIVYPALVPICCLGGIPISIWAGRCWTSPAVLARRQSTQARR
jgi:hypothetical protein